MKMDGFILGIFGVSLATIVPLFLWQFVLLSKYKIKTTLGGGFLMAAIPFIIIGYKKRRTNSDITIVPSVLYLISLSLPFLMFIAAIFLY